MKVLIVSDTHGKSKNLRTVLEKVGPVDAMIHCGDVEGEEDYLAALADCPSYIVTGNNDFFSDLPYELEEEFGGYHFLITHGHYLGASIGYEGLWDEGQARNVDVVAFGHTHKPVVLEKNGRYLVNPGSLSYPRQRGRRPTYMIMEIDRFGKIHFTINEL